MTSNIREIKTLVASFGPPGCSLAELVSACRATTTLDESEIAGFWPVLQRSSGFQFRDGEYEFDTPKPVIHTLAGKIIASMETIASLFALHGTLTLSDPISLAAFCYIHRKGDAGAEVPEIMEAINYDGLTKNFHYKVRLLMMQQSLSG